MKKITSHLKKVTRVLTATFPAKLFVLLFAVLVIAGSVSMASEYARAACCGGGRPLPDGGNDYGGPFGTPRSQIPPEIAPPGTGDVSTETQTSTKGSATGIVPAGASMQLNVTLNYAWNRWGGGSSLVLPSSDTVPTGWVPGLGQPSVSIGYEFGVSDAASGNPIPSGSSVPSGSRVKLKFNPYIPENIFWFGTGYSADSPYGEWRADAAPPSRAGNRVTCEDKDITAKYVYEGQYTFDVYIPLVVNPADRTFDIPSGFTDCTAATANSDGSVTETCTVQNTGSQNVTLTPSFKYSSTYGKFYYRYYDYRDMGVQGGPGCYGNNIALSQTNNVSDPYKVNFPAQTFPYQIVVAPDGNKSPTAPTLTCPSSVNVGQDVVVTLNSTDPDNDPVRYGVNWEGDSSAGVDSGWTRYVSSGTSESLTKTGGFPTGGSHTIVGWAQDVKGAMSAPSTCTVNVVAQKSDLTVLPPPDINMNIGESTTLTGQIKNQGPVSTGVPFPAMIRVKPQGAQEGTVKLFSDSTARGIPNGFPANYTEPVSTTWTPDTAKTYQYRICADYDESWHGKVPEEDEDNNCSAYGTITVAPDTTLTCTVDKTQVAVNENVTYTVAGGSTPFTWTGSDRVLNQTGRTANRTFPVDGLYDMTVSKPGNTSGVCPRVTVGTGQACTNPKVTITAAPNRIRPGGTSVVTYSATGAKVCTITGPGAPTVTPTACVVPDGTHFTTPGLTTQTTYTIDCDGVKATAIINVVPKFDEF